MIRRALVASLCWLLSWQPVWAACAFDGVSQTLTTYSLAVPVRSTTALTTISSNDLILLYASLNAEAVNSGGGPPTITGITGGGLIWTRRFRENHTITDCILGPSPCYPDVEVWATVAASPLTAQVFTVTADAGLSFANIYLAAVSGLSNPASPWDSNFALPSKGTNYTGTSGVPTAKEVMGVSTTNGDDILLYSCFQNAVTFGAGATCDVGTPSSGQPWTLIEQGYQQSIFNGFFDASSFWQQAVAAPIAGQTLTAQDQTKLATNWIAHADALVCSTSGTPVFPNVWINE